MWWKPTLSNTFLYELDRVAIKAPTVTTNTGLRLNKNIYIIDMEGHTTAQMCVRISRTIVWEREADLSVQRRLQVYASNETVGLDRAFS